MGSRSNRKVEGQQRDLSKSPGLWGLNSNVSRKRGTVIIGGEQRIN